MKTGPRPSEYLLAKAQNLRKTIRFFTGPDRTRRLVFLAQIDFWDWEMEELRYAVDNFAERSATWELPPAEMLAHLRRQGFALDDREAEKLAEWHHQLQRCKASFGERVTAPREEVAALINEWNELIRLCENLLNMKRAEAISAAGGWVVVNLDKYRKTPSDGRTAQPSQGAE